ncbi:MAG: DUF3108 domain-containing protein [Pseudodonghicola sp.]
MIAGAIRGLTICAALLLAPSGAVAEPIAARYAVQALGVRVGELVLTGSLEDRHYTVSSQFRTTGLAGALARVRFVLQASGTRAGARFFPTAYREEMNTGQRESRAQLSYDGGIARAALPGAPAVADSIQRGAVDPLTAILMVLRDREDDGLCDLRQRVFDGERLSEIALTGGEERAGEIVCTGLYRRLAGYPPEELRRRRDFALQIHYAAEAGAMRARRIRVETVYGPALLLRR